ncbi:MAG: hypothetical protein LBF86_06745 [Helicobacteraceae bacterium]|nr:hypothetical protein [Helicobacteraceae bacterium]
MKTAKVELQQTQLTRAPYNGGGGGRPRDRFLDAALGRFANYKKISTSYKEN